MSEFVPSSSPLLIRLSCQPTIPSHAEALAAATSVSAEACGLSDRKGLLRKGYDADILVVNGDVRADVAALADVRSVVLGGTVVR